MQLSAIIEALLFASHSPLTTEELARLVRASVAEAEDIRVRDAEEGKDSQALPEWLAALAATTPATVASALADLNHAYQHSQRAFTLTIIAYRQPITKAAIETVRGVACDGMIQKLLDRDLICIGGRAELPGRPLLYETTELFFEHFGIRSIDDLPNSTELRKVKLPEPAPPQPGPDVEQQLALSAIATPAAAEANPTHQAPEPA